MEATAVETRRKLLNSKVDAAFALGVSKRKVDLMIRAKQLHAVKIGRRTLIHSRELERVARAGAE